MIPSGIDDGAGGGLNGVVGIVVVGNTAAKDFSYRFDFFYPGNKVETVNQVPNLDRRDLFGSFRSGNESVGGQTNTGKMKIDGESNTKVTTVNVARGPRFIPKIVITTVANILFLNSRAPFGDGIGFVGETQTGVGLNDLDLRVADEASIIFGCVALYASDDTGDDRTDRESKAKIGGLEVMRGKVAGPGGGDRGIA